MNISFIQKILEFLFDLFQKIFTKKEKIEPAIIPPVIEQPKKTNVILPDIEKYFLGGQRDNPIDMGSTCFDTSIGILLAYIFKDGKKYDEILIQDIRGNRHNAALYKQKAIDLVGPEDGNAYLPDELFLFHVWYLKEKFGIKIRYSENINDIQKNIDAGFPVIAATEKTPSGHIMPIVGYDLTKIGFYVLDPFGRAPYLTAEDKANNKVIFYDGLDWLTGSYLMIK